MPIRHPLVRAVFLFLMLAAVAPAMAISPVNRTLLGGLAIDGYDPVAYFLDGKPIEGKKAHSFVWNDATWRFATAAHRELFVKSPESYAPQYGGYCAWAVSQGYTAGIEPEAWTVRDGKLYLNYDLEIQEKWRADLPGLIAKGDANWPGLLAEK